MRKRLIPFLIAAAILTAAGQAPAQTTSAPASGASLGALTSTFTTFITQILAAQVPSGNLAPTLQATMTPAVISQIDTLFANLGDFKKLQFVRQDEAQGYQRYHYSAIFDHGQVGLMFVVDANGAIAGFFQDPPM